MDLETDNKQSRGSEQSEVAKERGVDIPGSLHRFASVDCVGPCDRDSVIFLCYESAGIGIAPSNQPSVSHCVGVAAKDKGLSIGLDIVGAVPVFGNAASATAGVVRAGIAIDHALTKPAVALASGVYSAGSAINDPEHGLDSLIGAGSAGAGIGLALADLSLEGTKAIPIVGNFVSVATLGWDGYQAYKKYQSCMAGH